MMDDVRMSQSQAEFYGLLNHFVENRKNDFDALVGLEAPPDYVWKDKDYGNDDIRELDLIQVTEKDIKFTVNLRKSVRLYAICGV
jgi:hypothetical protein